MSYELNSSLINGSYSFILAGFLIIIIAISSTGPNASIALLTGYSAILCAVLIILGSGFNMFINTNTESNKLNYAKLGIALSPYLNVIFNTVLLITFVTIYFNKISANRVSDYYKTFSYISIFCLSIQIWLLVYPSINLGELKNTTYSVLGFIGTINTISVITLGIILKYYTTDGFGLLR